MSVSYVNIRAVQNYLLPFFVCVSQKHDYKDNKHNLRILILFPARSIGTWQPYIYGLLVLLGTACYAGKLPASNGFKRGQTNYVVNCLCAF